jgi:hypothetical protein
MGADMDLDKTKFLTLNAKMTKGTIIISSVSFMG